MTDKDACPHCGHNSGYTYPMQLLTYLKQHAEGNARAIEQRKKNRGTGRGNASCAAAVNRHQKWAAWAEWVEQKIKDEEA